MSPRNRGHELARVSRFAAALTLAVGGLLLAGTAPASAASGSGGDGGSGGEGGIGISVDVPATTQTPTPGPTDGGGQGDQGDHGGQGDQGGDGHGGSAGGHGDGTGHGDRAQDQGPVNVSGLHAQYRPSLNPAGGSVLIWLSIHNGSKSTIASTDRFWLTGPVGNVVSDSGTFAVPPIAPGATVVLSRTLQNVGQWTVLTAHATFTPPKSVDGVALAPVGRDVTIFAFPWLNTVALSVAGVCVAAVLKPSLVALLVHAVRPA